MSLKLITKQALMLQNKNVPKCIKTLTIFSTIVRGSVVTDECIIKMTVLITRPMPHVDFNPPNQ